MATPNFDDRLNAVRETLELVASMQLDNARRFDERFAKVMKARERNGEHINALARIAEAH